MKTLRAYAPFLLRLSFGYQLLNASHSSVFSMTSLRGYADFLDKLGFPLPLVAAFLSANTEFFGGLLMIVGWQTRLAGTLLAVNFALAVVVGHWLIHDTYANTYPALHLLAMSLFLILNGPGKPSVEEGL